MANEELVKSLETSNELRCIGVVWGWVASHLEESWSNVLLSTDS